MAEISAATESPPCPPDSNGDRVDCELARSDEETPEPRAPQKPRRSMSEKQLETLRKAREAKAAKRSKPEPFCAKGACEPEPEPQVPKPFRAKGACPRKDTKPSPKPFRAKGACETPKPLTRSHTNQSLTIF
jgi:hypothetical protein